MNDLISNQNKPTMSSREIAKLTAKQHSKVMRTIDDLINKGIAKMATLSSERNEQNGQEYNVYLLDKRDSLVLVARLSPEFTAAIVDRWQELESNQAPTPRAFQIPQTLAEALQLAADQAKQLELQAPKVAFVERLVERQNLLNATQVGQPHKISAIKLNQILDDFGGVYNKSVKRGRAFCQPWIDGGYGEMKVTESGHNQCLFTVKGEQRINEILICEGIV